MLEKGRGLFWLLVVGFVGFVLATVGRLPPLVASHFGAAGVPNGWSTRSGYAGLLLVIGALLPIGIIAMVNRLSGRGPDRLNIPARQYWSRPEHGEEAVRRVQAYMWWFGCLLTGLALAVHALILEAHRAHPPRLSNAAFLAVVGAEVLGVGLWIAGWYRLLRPPVERSFPP